MIVGTSNLVKHKLSERQKISAAWLQAGSNITAEILGEAGFDLLIIDLEHGPGDIPVLITQIQAMKGERGVPMVRSAWNDSVLIKRILDAGAYGLLVPQVNDKEQALQAVRAIKYPTAGVRGVAGSVRAAHYGNKPMRYLESANDEIVLMLAVETFEAVRNIDDLIAVDGVDAIFIGPSDLSSSMGHLGKPEHPEVQEAISRVEQAVIPSHVALATISGSFQDAEEKYNKGYDIITLMSDTSTLSMVACNLVSQFESCFG